MLLSIRLRMPVSFGHAGAFRQITFPEPMRPDDVYRKFASGWFEMQPSLFVRNKFARFQPGQDLSCAIDADTQCASHALERRLLAVGLTLQNVFEGILLL